MSVGIFDSLRDYEGGWSCQRIVTMVVCLSVISMWVYGCISEGKFVHLDWADVSLLVGSQSAKAAQMHFEQGFHSEGGADPSEGDA